ncbi:MAG: shikimate kinase [Candidatus Nitrosocaldaceae archaeon]|nr:MAG: shikimate kinase [Candidatus Nitrosocaldaceae archaeon]
MRVRSIAYGAISIVNAIPLGIGATLGVGLNVVADVELSSGKGIKIDNKQNNQLIKEIIARIIPKELLEKNCLKIELRSSIPSSYGLKSSSAVSNALSLALTRLIKEEYDDFEVINYGIDASLAAKVSITGAFDDASASYFGGFVVTDNYARKIIRHERADDLNVIILLPDNIKRSDPLRLRRLANLFEEPVRLAKEGRYWEAMILNGVLVASILGIPYKPIKEAMEAGAMAASVSGNGPAIAVITHNDGIEGKLSKYGKIITTRTNNNKARVDVIE